MARRPRALRLVEYRPTAHGARAAQFAISMGSVVGQREERSSPSRWLRLDCTNTATDRLHRLWNAVVAARGFRDVWPARFPPHRVSSDNPRSSHRAVRSSHGGRASPRAIEQGLDRTSTTVGQWHGLRKVLITTSYPVARDLRAFASCRTGRPPRSTLRAVRTCSGSVVGQRRVRSSPRHRSGLNRTNTATGRRHGLRNFVTTTVQLLWRPARALCAVWRVSVDRPQSTRRAVRTWRGCVVTQRETSSSPSRRLRSYCTNTAAGWRH